MAGTFNFCPNSQVPELLPPEPTQGVSMNGWSFSSKPSIPYQRRFKLTLHGMQWFLTSGGAFDETTSPTTNARVLEKFYQSNGTWDNFTWVHPHLGSMQCRFSAALTVPAGLPRSNGLLDPLEVMLVEYNAGYV